MTRTRLCDRCQQRHAQDKTGLCRRCKRELGDTSTMFEREAASVARLHARFKGGLIPAEDLAPRPDKTIILEGTEWIIVWDGT